MDWLLWVDIETTGLNPQTDHILEIAYVLTDFTLTKYYTFPELTIQHDLKNLVMDTWCFETHTQSGLLNKVQQSITSLMDAENTMLTLINSYLTIQDKLHIAGNSVHFDKKFIDVFMKRLSKRLSHRIVDVSTLAIVTKNLKPNIYEQRPQKRYFHTAQNDILESIQEYKYYMNNLL